MWILKIRMKKSKISDEKKWNKEKIGIENDKKKFLSTKKAYEFVVQWRRSVNFKWV